MPSVTDDLRKPPGLSSLASVSRVHPRKQLRTESPALPGVGGAWGPGPPDARTRPALVVRSVSPAEAGLGAPARGLPLLFPHRTPGSESQGDLRGFLGSVSFAVDCPQFQGLSKTRPRWNKTAHRVRAGGSVSRRQGAAGVSRPSGGPAATTLAPARAGL